MDGGLTRVQIALLRLDIRIVTLLVTDRRRWSVAWQHLRLLLKLEQLVVNGGIQFARAAAGKIRAADRHPEQHVSAEQQILRSEVEAHAARGVARRMVDIEGFSEQDQLLSPL